MYMGIFEVGKMLMSLLELFIDSASLITCIALYNAQMVGDSCGLGRGEMAFVAFNTAGSIAAMQ